MKTKVAFAKCADYSGACVRPAMEQVLSALGGMESFVARGQRVLLKPNLLTDKEPERAVTTHPSVLRELIRLVRQCGAEPAVADSPANVTKLERVWEATGVRALCEEEKVPLINLEKAGSKHLSVGAISFTVAQPVLDADVVINVPKVKTHVLTIFTGAVKNMYGVVPGFHKTTLHKLYPTPSEFGTLLVALYGKVRPRLSIADAVVGMEGDGPSGGRPVKLGFIAGSSDGVALDVALCRILGIGLRSVPYFDGLARAGLGETRWEEIEAVGCDPKELVPPKFSVPSTLIGRLIPRPLARLLRPYLWIRPRFLDRCVSCGRCVKACPMTALSVEKGSRPRLDGGKCVACFCCHEVCPERAVEMGMSPLLSAIRRGRLP